MRKLLLLVVASCSGTFGTADPPPRTTSAEIAAVTRDRALDEIADARCSREFSCDHVGAGHEFRDYDSCTRRVRLSMRDSLGGQSCDDGVDAYILATCLSDIRTLHCDANDGTVERYGTCANQKLCRR